MEYIEVTGGNPLRGSIRPAAAKNSVLPLLAATLLCAQPCTLRRVPLLRDVQTSLDLLRAVGSGAAWAGQDLVTQPSRQISGRVPTALAGGYAGVGVLPGTAVDPRGLGRAAAARRVQTGAAAH